LTRLAARLDISPADLETRLGKPVTALVRTEAKDWIKKLREMANEVAPSHKVRYGLWPGAREDQEAAYLGQKRDEGAQLAFKLFNGDEVSGTISEFTPYTITLTTAAGDTMVLRKLAVVYYRQTAAGTGPAIANVGKDSADHLHEPEIDSDRAGEPARPEADNMDRDRGV
jgi:sRNA-binding regulator protein Hfq